MKLYVMLNTQLRTAAKNESEEEFFKRFWKDDGKYQEPQKHEVTDKLKRKCKVCDEARL